MVALAAGEAIDRGRRHLWAIRCAAGQPGGADLRGPMVQLAAVGAVSRFWAVLADFVADRRDLPGPGWGGVGPDHPFLAVAEGEERLQVHAPPALAMALLCYVLVRRTHDSAS